MEKLNKKPRRVDPNTSVLVAATPLWVERGPPPEAPADDAAGGALPQACFNAVRFH